MILLRAIVLMVCTVRLACAAADAHWPEFRGPRADGTSLSANLPLHWGENKNVKWKTAIHGRGWSSPVTWDKQVWITTASENGRELSAVCVDLDTGKILHDLKVFDVEQPQYCHPFNSYASPTPVIEPGRVYVTFGSPGTACIDTTTAAVLWTRRDLECNHFRGAGSSPILHGTALYLNYDGSDRQYVVAMDKNTGRNIWLRQRSVDYRDLDLNGKPQLEGDYRKAFATCRVADFDGTRVLLSQGSKALYAYNLADGAEIWRVEEHTSYSGSTRPLVGHGMVFVPSGFPSGQVLAIRPGRSGETLDAKTNAAPEMQLQVVWKSKRNAPKKPSLLLVGELLYAVDDNGTVTCWNARDGETLWSERIPGNYSASPLAAPGRLYFFNETGKTTVLAEGKEHRKLSENDLGDGFMASPAVAGNALILRSRSHLYRVEE